MSTDDRSRDPAAPGRTNPAGEPLRMTEAEKRRAEWEARHDVAARGHHAAPDVVQHYFAHDRLTHPAAPHPSKAAGASAAGTPHGAPPEGPRQSPRQGFLRRLFSRRGAGDGRA